MNRYLRLLKLFAKISLQRQMAHPLSFFLAFVGKSLRMGLLIVFWNVIFGVVPEIKGWDIEKTLIFIAFYTTLETSMVISYHRNLFYYLPNMIKKGEFDFLLTKPVPALFYASSRIVDVMDASSAIVPLGLWLTIFAREPHLLSPAFIGKFIILFFIGFISLYGLTLLVASSAFWTLTSTGTGRAFEGFIRIARFPIDFLPQPWRGMLTFVIPIAFIATVPAKVITQGFDYGVILAGFGLTAVMPALGLYVWNAGLKRYASASS